MSIEEHVRAGRDWIRARYAGQKLAKFDYDKGSLVTGPSETTAWAPMRILSPDQIARFEECLRKLTEGE